MKRTCGICCDTVTICATVYGCFDSLIVYAGLTPAVSYYAWFEDQFSNAYMQQVTAGADGSLIIDTTKADDFPASLFNPVAGALFFFVTTDDKMYERVSLNIRVPDCPGDTIEATDTVIGILINFAAGPIVSTVGLPTI